MKLTSPRASRALVLGGLASATTGCDVVEGIFKAGVWVGIIIVLVVIGLIAWALKAVLS
jgi:hypothetical protein